jgi:uncharacterized iron-regulated protein
MVFPVLFLAAALVQGTPTDPLLLPIGPSKTVAVKTGALTDLRRGRQVTPEDIAKAAEGTRYVYLGEEHTNADHHKMQAAIIRALAADGRHVVVGMEQFTRPVQPNLAGWTLGWYTDDEFIAKSDWKNQWGLPYELYKPIFDAAKDLQLPIVALNIPRPWVHAVGQGGLAALPEDAKTQLPSEIDVNNKDHRAVFMSLMGGHPMTGMENMYSAQVLWDVAMADTAVKYMADRPSDKTVMVVIAGSGHVMYHQGINWRVAKRTGDHGLTVVMGENDGDRKVSAGVADYFYLTAPSPAKS